MNRSRLPVSVSRRTEIGKVVRFHRGPAAVIGDERHTRPFVDRVRCGRRNVLLHGEGVASRMIRKPEDLPVTAAL